MEIRNIYSSYDNYGYEDERLYSVLMDEYELALFSKAKEEAEEDYRIPLSAYNSNKGLKRTIAGAVLSSGVPLGRKAGLKAAELADLEGDPDYEIVRKAGKAGLKTGAISGAAINTGLGAALGAGIGLLAKKAVGADMAKKAGIGPLKQAGIGALGGALGGALFGGIGGRNSARVLVKDKIRQRDEEDKRQRESRRKK